jgi:sulfite dehydrogenase (cytochrome) subunit B
MSKTIRFCAAALCLAGSAAFADEQPVTLKAGPNKEIVENNCNACHSLDYIVINSPFLSDKQWEAEVTKMIKTFGAPIEEAEAKQILIYLTKTYGAQ